MVIEKVLEIKQDRFGRHGVYVVDSNVKLSDVYTLFNYDYDVDLIADIFEIEEWKISSILLMKESIDNVFKSNDTYVINIVGQSGTGKTTLARLLELSVDNVNVIQSYTTRPPREDDEYGHTFIEFFDTIIDKINNKLIGIRTVDDRYFDCKSIIAYFNSYKSGHHYFATDEQVIPNKVNLYVVDPNGARSVENYYKNSDVKVLTVKLECDRIELERRLINRDGNANRMKEDEIIFKDFEYDIKLIVD